MVPHNEGEEEDLRPLPPGASRSRHDLGLGVVRPWVWLLLSWARPPDTGVGRDARTPLETETETLDMGMAQARQPLGLEGWQNVKEERVLGLLQGVERYPAAGLLQCAGLGAMTRAVLDG